MATTVITDLAIISSLNRGPLTSIFTPPASCLSTLTYGTNMYFGHYGDQYSDLACYPPMQMQQTLSDPWAVYYYSPGQCPLGWWEATTFQLAFPGDKTSLLLGAATTAVGCCPSGFLYTMSDLGHICESTVSDLSLKYITPTFISNSFFRGSLSTTTIGTGPYTIRGDGVPVWWQSSDLAAFASAASMVITSSSSASSTSTSSNSGVSSRTASSSVSPGSSLTVSTPSPTSTTTASPSISASASSGLAENTKISLGVGIGIGLPAFAVLLFCLVYFFRRLERHRIDSHFNDDPALANGFPKDQPEVQEMPSMPLS